MQYDMETRKKKAKWKLRAILTTVLMCAILMLWLVADEPSTAELTIFRHAREKGISALRYPDYLVELLERNDETKEFVLNYPFRNEKPEIDLSSYDSSQGVPLFKQWDERWGYMEYGDEMVATYGSGPMCLAMAGYRLTKLAQFYPDRVVEYARDNGYWTEIGGSKWSLFTIGAPDLGLKVMELAPVESKIASYLQNGSLIVAAMDAGDFADVTRFVLLTGYSDGKISLNDPDSLFNSGTRWEFSQLEEDILKLWVIQAGSAG